MAKRKKKAKKRTASRKKKVVKRRKPAKRKKTTARKKSARKAIRKTAPRKVKAMAAKPKTSPRPAMTKPATMIPAYSGGAPAMAATATAESRTKRNPAAYQEFDTSQKYLEGEYAAPERNEVDTEDDFSDTVEDEAEEEDVAARRTPLTAQRPFRGDDE